MNTKKTKGVRKTMLECLLCLKWPHPIIRAKTNVSAFLNKSVSTATRENSGHPSAVRAGGGIDINISNVLKVYNKLNLY